MMKTLVFTDQELQSLINLLDAGVRSQGIRGVPDANRILYKIQNAQQQEESKEAERNDLPAAE